MAYPNKCVKKYRCYFQSSSLPPPCTTNIYQRKYTLELVSEVPWLDIG